MTQEGQCIPLTASAQEPEPIICATLPSSGSVGSSPLNLDLKLHRQSKPNQALKSLDKQFGKTHSDFKNK